MTEVTKSNILAMIPARIGSERLKMKNLALLNGRSLISHSIEAAKNSGVFDQIIINSDSALFSAIAGQHGVRFYQRPTELGGSEIKSDVVVADFIKKFPCEILVWVNPIAPLQPSREIKEGVHYFQKEGLDSLITVRSNQVHSMFKGRPVNFDMKEPFAKTQNLVPVETFVYSLMMWRVETFLKTFEKEGAAILCGKFGTFPVCFESSIIIKRHEDLLLAEHVLKSRDSLKEQKISYDPLVTSVEGRV